MNALSRAGFGSIDSSRTIALLFLIPVSIGVGLATAWSASPLIVGAIVAIVPIIMLQTTFIRNLFIGIVFFLIFEYLQPGHRIPALAKLRPSMVIAGSLLLAWILNLMQHRVKVVMNWQVKSYAIILFLGVAGAFTAISAGMVQKTTTGLAKTLIVFLVMFTVVNTVPKLKNLIWTYVILHLILAVMAFGLFFTTGDRNFGDLGGAFLGDENDSAMALLLMIPYAYFMFGEAKQKWFRTALIVSMIASSGAVLYSFSRGAFIGFVTMVAYVWWKGQNKGRNAIILLAVLGLFFAFMPGEYWDRIESIEDYGTEGSAQGRLDAWKGGVKILINNPLFGAGLGNFNRTYGSGYNTITARWTAAHSMYVQFIGELGVPGVIFIITTIVLTFKTFGRIRRECRDKDGAEYKTLLAIARGGECGFATYLVTTIFLNSMAYPHLWHFGAVAGCGILALEDLKRRDKKSETDLAVIEAAETAAIP